MSSQNQKRVTVKLKCPNPLFEGWLEIWKQEAATKESKMQYIFQKAQQSLRKYPLPLESGRDCKILKGFGDKLCKMLDDKLIEHKRTHGSVNTVNNVLPLLNNHVKITNKSASKIESQSVLGSSNKQYIPQYGSGGYGILVALYRKSRDPDYPGYLSKADIIQHGKDLVNSSFTKPDPGCRYTAWSSMRTLLSKNLVLKTSHPPKFSLTHEGENLAKKLYENSFKNGDKREENNEHKRVSGSLETNNLINKTTAEIEIADNFKTYDIDIPDEMADDIFRNAWFPAIDTLEHIENKKDNRDVGVIELDKISSDNKQKNIISDSCGVDERVSCKKFLKTTNSIDCSEKCASGISTLQSNKFKKSVSSQEISVNKPTSSVQYDGKSFHKYNSTNSVSTSEPVMNVQSRNKPHLFKKRTASSFITSSKSTVSIMENFVMAPNSFDIILYVDNNETQGSHNSHNDEILLTLRKYGIKYEVTDLKVGDFIWICKDKVTSKELVLPYIVERKRMDDFAHSIKDKRYYEQKFRLKKSGIENLIYLVESHGKNQHLGLPLHTLYQAATNTAIQEKFFIKFTDNTRETVEYLANFSRIITNIFKSKTLASCPKDDIQPVDMKDDLVSLITFKEFNESSVKNKRMKITDLFVKMLIQIKGMSVERALAITKIYPTPALLRKAYQENLGGQGEKLLSGIKYGKYKKDIGASLSKIVYQTLNKHHY